MSNVKLADLDLLALVEPAVGREVAHAGHAEIRAARDDVVEKIFVGEVRAFDRHFQRVAQFSRAADVVDMAMRDPDLIDGHLGLLDRRQNIRNVAAGIDHHGAFGRLAPQQRAVLLERGDRHDQSAGLRGLLGGCLGFFCHAATMLIFRAAPSGFRHFFMTACRASAGSGLVESG